jgi:hypothetical protein
VPRNSEIQEIAELTFMEKCGTIIHIVAYTETKGNKTELYAEKIGKMCTGI